MAKRLFEDNDAWADITSRCSNEVEALFAAVLAQVEAELGEPVDLRDFHFVGANALASFVADLSIRRRLGAEGVGPKEIVQHYPRLTLPLEVSADIIVEGVQKWDCPGLGLSTTVHSNGYCLYNHTEDPIHDNCILCDQPEERK